MSERVLFVDDEIHILDSMKRQLRKRFEVVTALSGREALEKCKKEGPFNVVVSDMRMPEMDGIELLSLIKEMYPDTVRMMLTGNADQQTAIEAVNKGQIFKFLNKPCPISVLAPSLALAFRQYRLVTAERELLDKTLKGSVKVLSELLSFASPTAFGSGLRIRPLVVKIAEALSLHNIWQLEIAALMSQVGCVTLPPELVNKIYSNSELDDNELEMYQNHPDSGARLLENIPRLDGVASIIRNQLKDFSGYDLDDDNDEETDRGAQILRAVFDYDLLLFQGKNHNQALQCLQKRDDCYNMQIVKILSGLGRSVPRSQVTSLKVRDLAVGMIVEENIISQKDMLLAPKGQEITLTVLQGLRNFARQGGVKEPVRIRIAFDIDSET